MRLERREQALVLEVVADERNRRRGGAELFDRETVVLAGSDAGCARTRLDHIDRMTAVPAVRAPVPTCSSRCRRSWVETSRSRSGSAASRLFRTRKRRPRQPFAVCPPAVIATARARVRPLQPCPSRRIPVEGEQRGREGVRVGGVVEPSLAAVFDKAGERGIAAPRRAVQTPCTRRSSAATSRNPVRAIDAARRRTAPHRCPGGERRGHDVVRQRAGEHEGPSFRPRPRERPPIPVRANQDRADVADALRAQRVDRTDEMNRAVPCAERAGEDGDRAAGRANGAGAAHRRTEAIGVGAPFDLEHAVGRRPTPGTVARLGVMKRSVCAHCQSRQRRIGFDEQRAVDRRFAEPG